MTVSEKGRSDTEQRILQLIANHAIEHPGKKLGKAQLAAAAGITRQALHRYYSHLTSYISGEKPVSDLLDSVAKEAVFSTGIEKLKALEAELEAVKAGIDKKIKRVRDEYITSLMKSDLALHDADGLRARLEAQSLHNDILINQIKSLESALTAAKLDSRERAASVISVSSNVTVFDINLKKIFEQYQVSGDKARLDAEKVAAVQGAIARAHDSGALEDATLVLFIDRYMCSFEVFCKNFKYQRNGKFVIVRAPIFSALQLKSLVLAKLGGETPAKIFMPYCESASVAKAQRAFYFAHVPLHEIALADKLQVHTMLGNRVNEVVMYRIEQGE